MPDTQSFVLAPVSSLAVRGVTLEDSVLPWKQANKFLYASLEMRDQSSTCTSSNTSASKSVPMGLLYLLGKAVTEAGVDVRAAIVSTLGAEACDSLYITEVDGRPLDPKRALAVAQSIEQQLRANKI